jgi:hypothetical protein
MLREREVRRLELARWQQKERAKPSRKARTIDRIGFYLKWICSDE